MTDNIVQQGEASVNAETPEARLERTLLDVAFWRALLTTHKDIMAARRRAFEVANAGAILNVTRTTEEVAIFEQTARDLALAIHAETGSKQPHAGVGIRVTTRMVYDRHIAFDWAVDHSIALALDIKAFENIAKSGAVDGGFVTYQVEPTATIATDLTKALGIEPVAEAEPETQRDIDEEKGDQAYHASRDAWIEAAGGN